MAATASDERATDRRGQRGRGAAGRSGYLPVSEHRLIGDLHSVALVGTNGTIDWHCGPSFDSLAVFGSLLDADRVRWPPRCRRQPGSSTTPIRTC
jgi:Domain of unknown function (DUF5911)